MDVRAQLETQPQDTQSLIEVFHRGLGAEDQAVAGSSDGSQADFLKMANATERLRRGGLAKGISTLSDLVADYQLRYWLGENEIDDLGYVDSGIEHINRNGDGKDVFRILEVVD